jgi:hypothetical protein
MNGSRAHAQPLDELIDDDLPAEELERLDRVDAVLRVAAALDGSLCECASTRRPHRGDRQTYQLKLTFAELALVYKSLQAVKTLGASPAQDELLDDTIQLVDQALKGRV